jgi:hypothetical protein
MHIEGDMSKLSDQIGEIEFTDFSISLQKYFKLLFKKINKFLMKVSDFIAGIFRKKKGLKCLSYQSV